MAKMTGEERLYDVITQHPELIDIFLKHGFRSLRETLQDDVRRHYLDRTLTIEWACLRDGVDLKKLMKDLNENIVTSEI